MVSNANYKNIYAPASSTYYYILSIYWEEQSYSIENNTSYIWGRARLESRGISFSGNGSSCLYLYWHDNHTNTDTLINSIIPGSMGTNDTFDVTGGLNVGHNDDGKLSGYAYAYWWKKSSNNYVPATDTVYTDWTALTTIPRTSTVSATSGYIGSDITINIGKKAESFTTTLTYLFGDKQGTIVEKTPYSSVAFSVPLSFYGNIPNSQTGVGNIFAYTYSGDTYIGASSTEFYVSANPSVASPSVEITSVVDTNQKTIRLTGDDTKLIRYCSTALVSTARTTQYYASVRNLYINNVDVGTSATTSSIANVDTNTFNATVYDTRGFSSNATPVVKDATHYIEYIPLTLSIKKLERNTPLDNQVKLQYEGKYFNSSFGATNNNLIIRWKYKEVGASEYSQWTTLSPTIDGNGYSQTLLLDYNPDTPPTSEDAPYDHTGTTVFNYEKSYEFVVEALDKINDNGEVGITQTISQGIPVYWWNKNSFTSEVDFFLKGTNIIDIIHPVGSIYLTLDNANPSTLFGGTWEQISQGRTLLGAGHPQSNSDDEFGVITQDQYTWTFNAGNTAGAYTHSHSLSDNGYAKMTIWNSKGGLLGYNEVGGKSTWYTNYGGYVSSSGAYSESSTFGAGLGGTSDTQWSIQPYFVVYIWKRTA